MDSLSTSNLIFVLSLLQATSKEYGPFIAVVVRSLIHAINIELKDIQQLICTHDDYKRIKKQVHIIIRNDS